MGAGRGALAADALGLPSRLSRDPSPSTGWVDIDGNRRAHRITRGEHSPHHPEGLTSSGDSRTLHQVLSLRRVMAVSPESLHDEISTTDFCPECTEGTLAEADLLIEEMNRRWKAGERPLAEHYLNRRPDLWGKPDEALEIIYEEISLRHRHADAPAFND